MAANPDTGDKCDPRPGHHRPSPHHRATPSDGGTDPCKWPTRPTGPKGSNGPCADIDAQQDSSDYELRAALTN